MFWLVSNYPASDRAENNANTRRVCRISVGSTAQQQIFDRDFFTNWLSELWHNPVFFRCLTVGGPLGTMPTPSCGRSGGSIHHPPPPPSAATAAAATTTTSAQQPTSNSSNINIFDARTADFYHVFSRRKKIILLFFSAAKIFAKKCIRSHSFFGREPGALE